MLYKLTCEAMATIDASYWSKCIDHMYKEVIYYMKHDRQLEDSDSEPEPQFPLESIESAVAPMDIDVRSKT